MAKKLKIGWFSFTCCEDSTMIWIELMNQNFFKWKDILDIKAWGRVLRKKNDLNDIDVAFVEGAITNEGRKKAQKDKEPFEEMVAIGSCAINGMPAAQRNVYDAELKKEIHFLIIRFKRRKGPNDKGHSQLRMKSPAAPWRKRYSSTYSRSISRNLVYKADA